MPPNGDIIASCVYTFLSTSEKWSNGWVRGVGRGEGARKGKDGEKVSLKMGNQSRISAHRDNLSFPLKEKGDQK